MIRRLFAIPGGHAEPPTDITHSLSVDEAYAYCEGVAPSRWSDWPLFARFVPAEHLPPLAAICAFVRHADEISSSSEPEMERHAALDAWEDELIRAWHGEAEHPILVALAHTAATRELPIAPLSELLTALRMDVSIRRYATHQALDGYLNNAAVPLGRILLHLFGQQDAVRDRYAADFSMALLFTHLIADVRRDAARGLIYLPQQDLAHFEVKEADLLAPVWAPPARHLIRFQTARARAMFLRGRPLLESLSGRLAEISLVLWGRGMALLSLIEQAGDANHAPLPLDTAPDAAGSPLAVIRS